MSTMLEWLDRHGVIPDPLTASLIPDESDVSTLGEIALIHYSITAAIGPELLPPTVQQS